MQSIPNSMKMKLKEIKKEAFLRSLDKLKEIKKEAFLRSLDKLKDSKEEIFHSLKIKEIREMIQLSPN